MTARQFGFVVARGLAVVSWLFATNDVKTFYGIYLMSSPLPRPWTILGITGLVFALEILIGAFLWTNAERFAGRSDDAAPTVEGGDWVVRLVFQALGTFLMVLALTSAFPYLSGLLFLSAMDKPPIYAPLVGEIVKFLIGLGLVLFNRFKRSAY